jgi:hypothetical protein
LAEIPAAERGLFFSPFPVLLRSVSVDPEPPDFSSSSPISEAVVASAVAAQAADSSGHRKPVHTHCENCGTALSGPYCHHCGQHDIDFHRSFGHMFLDALENFFHFDAKLFRNIVTLLFRPGRLTAAFNAGKRASQMPPLRLYIFVSVLFFFLSFLGRKNDNLFVADPSDLNNPVAKKHLADAVEDIKARKAVRNSAGAASATPVEEKKKRPAETPGGLNIFGDDKNNTELERYLNDKGRYAVDHQREMAEAFLHALPKMLLVCLPFFALFTRVLFRHSGQVYLQHLVVALHFHTFIFLWRMFASGWAFLAHFLSPKLAGFLGFGANLWLFLYVFLMLRHLFQNSWGRTIFKTLALAGAYGVTLGLGFGITAIVIFLLL